MGWGVIYEEAYRTGDAASSQISHRDELQIEDEVFFFVMEVKE